MLRFSRAFSTEILKDFECGIPVLDDFIHGSLASFLERDKRYSLWVLKDDSLEIIAMVVTSNSIFIDSEGEFKDIPAGKPWAYFDNDYQIHSGTMYPTLEIDYLAVSKDLRNKGYVTDIIHHLERQALQRGCYFLTVDAYHDKTYSAVPFYEKRGFFALQEYSEDYETLRMALRVK